MNRNPDGLSVSPPDFRSSHLSDEDLDDILLGIASPVLTAHTASCASCTERLAPFRSAVGVFNQASGAWSHARSNTLTRDLSTHQPQPRFTLAAARSYGAAVILAAALMLTAGIHHRRVATQAPVPSQAIGNQELASDNAMLAEIDMELSRPVAMPADIDAEPSSRREHRPNRQVRN